ncbi:phosphatidate cytidylyltransferase [Qipengyuania spongiae]|uniref:Phosphatidate cytidylyltransferase n=1 Tax=Qipengyuania spongiae TaxID=2909673 RepID=A0ABY5T0V1_9SPHN|nr:phosphatidate cytidylyltransferase [Qipengyuania spongiae]UVI38554.1 phosphatidate cytidylyltransferase [Qipengyuania spongiae]
MAAEPAPQRKRDRFKARMRRYVDVPLSVRTSDLPKRVASAVVMLAAAGTAIWIGGVVLRAFIYLVALAAFGEFVRLVWRATQSLSIRAIGLLLGAAYIGLAAYGLAGLDLYHIVAVLGIVIFTDTCAYFSGRSIGGRKIAPTISPSKTWAGLIGGMAGSALWLVIFMAMMHNTGDFLRLADDYSIAPLEAAMWALAGALLAVAAQAGDFFESWLKRRAKMKDSSNLIPGHGGVFDRIDGMLPVALILGLLAGSL